jgi:hypothetical protein
MHMWVRFAARRTRADLGGAYLICSMTSVTRRAGGVAFVGLSFLLQPVPPDEGRLLASSPLVGGSCCATLERVSVSCSGTAALWHGLAWACPMSLNLQYQP